MPVRSPKAFRLRLERRKTKTRPNKQIVRPGRLHARSGDKVSFRAPAGTDIEIWIPKAREIFGLKEPLIFTVRRKKTSKPYKVIVRPRKAKEYAYAIYCKQYDDFAEANSSPIMIIEPPPEPGKGPGSG